MKILLHIRKNHNRGNITSIDLIKRLPSKNNPNSVKYQMNKWYDKSEFQYYDNGNFEVEFKGDKVKIVKLCTFVKFPEHIPGYSGKTETVKLADNYNYSHNI